MHVTAAHTYMDAHTCIHTHTTAHINTCTPTCTYTQRTRTRTHAGAPTFPGEPVVPAVTTRSVSIHSKCAGAQDPPAENRRPRPRWARSCLHLGSDSRGQWLPTSPGWCRRSVTQGLTHGLCRQLEPGSNPTSDTCRPGDLRQVS